MKEQILALRAQGLSYRQIQTKLKCSKATINYHCTDIGKTKTRLRNKQRLASSPLIAKTEHFRSPSSNARLRRVSGAYQHRNSSTRALSMRIRDFQRRNGSKLTRAIMTFTTEDALAKIGPTPQCYLTGRQVDLDDHNAYSFDHIVPATRGGANDLNNLGLACRPANQAKSDLTMPEFLQLCKEVLTHHGYIITKNMAVVQGLEP